MRRKIIATMILALIGCVTIRYISKKIRKE